MASYDPSVFEPTLTAAPTALSGGGRGGGGLGATPDDMAHHGVVGLVLVSLLVLFLLDKAGFRFAVTVGKR